MFSILGSFLAIEYKALIRKPSKIIYPGIFYLIILAILPFTISNEILANKYIVVAFLTISILFAIHVNYSGMFEEDIKDGFLEQLIMTGLALPFFIFSKILFNTILVFSSIIITFPLLILFFNFSTEIFFYFAFLSFALSFSLITIVTFSSALTTGIKNGLVITLIISFPLSLSLLIDFCLICNELVILCYIKEKTWLVGIMLGKILFITPLVVYLSKISLADAVNNFK